MKRLFVLIRSLLFAGPVLVLSGCDADMMSAVTQGLNAARTGNYTAQYVPPSSYSSSGGGGTTNSMADNSTTGQSYSQPPSQHPAHVAVISPSSPQTTGSNTPYEPEPVVNVNVSNGLHSHVGNLAGLQITVWYQTSSGRVATRGGIADGRGFATISLPKDTRAICVEVGHVSDIWRDSYNGRLFSSGETVSLTYDGINPDWQSLANTTPFQILQR